MCLLRPKQMLAEYLIDASGCLKSDPCGSCRVIAAMVYAFSVLRSYSYSLLKLPAQAAAAFQIGKGALDDVMIRRLIVQNGVIVSAMDA